ncbi:MAG: AAA family ATPase [Peptococcaceae bacterium]
MGNGGCDNQGKKINSGVTEEVISAIGGLSVFETKEQLQQKFDETKVLLDKVADVTTSYPVPIGGVKYTDGFERVICNLLAKLVEKPVLTERESMILSMIQNGRQSIVEAAKKDFSDGTTTVCPYCFQELDGEYRRSLIHSINKVLNKDVDEHKAELLAISFPEFGQDYSQFTDLDAGLVKKIQEQVENCQNLMEQYKAVIQQKLNSIYNPIKIVPIGLEKSIQQLNALLSELESKRQKIVDAVQQREKIQQELLLINKKIAHLQIRQAYRDYLKQQRAMRDAEDKMKINQKAVNETSERLKAFELQKSNVGLAIENINNALDYVFFSQGRLSIELKNDKYYLKSNGNDVKPKNVSLGERNIIALCYFFTQILSNQDVRRLYQDEELVVIDDPISSFDFENKVGISSFLRYQTHKIIKGNIKSKILFLTHDLSTFSDLQKIADEIEKSFKKQNSNVIVKSKSFELQGRTLSNPIKSINEYRDLLYMIFKYATGKTEGLDLVIGNSMRRALEAFSTFIYGIGIAEVSFDPKVIKSLGNHSKYFENLMYRLVLHGESHFETRIYTMQDDLSFYRFISEEEKQRTCKEVLCFMYCLSPDHIESHIPDAICKIQKWMEDISTNEEFDIIDNPKKRIIHLYDTPLSAGLGENILDSDLPFVEYETNVEDGDFALRVSGDSMEPDIPDGSIIVIKNQSEIADGISGAFFLNGEVFCKKLLHKDGKVFLCSDNAEYQPIEVHDGDNLIVYGKVVKVLC